MEVVKHGRGQDVVADRHNRRGSLLGRVGIFMIECEWLVVDNAAGEAVFEPRCSEKGSCLLSPFLTKQEHVLRCRYFPKLYFLRGRGIGGKTDCFV